ncbi:YppF family protein [Niallia oryzisoli]|uniref:YppF family protein n=1 Tax=Niallia oryzisoli TaxID=1737571 RepID=UPI0037354C1D
MLLENLIYRYTLEKKRKPSHVNELLDYLQKGYIYGEFSIVEYKQLFSELNERNAEKPQFFIIKSKPYDIYYYFTS